MKSEQKERYENRYAYMIESNRNVKRVRIQSEFGGIYTVRFENGGATKVKSHRLFPSAEAAAAAIGEAEKQARKHRTPYM